MKGRSIMEPDSPGKRLLFPPEIFKFFQWYLTLPVTKIKRDKSIVE